MNILGVCLCLCAGAPPGAACPGRPAGRCDPDGHQRHEQSQQ